MDLRDQWNRLLPHAQPLGDDLLARYAESHRHYHDQRHLSEMLETIDELAAVADDADAVRLAAWFHDAIYDPQAEPGENEEVSAQLAELELSAYGVEADRVAEIGRLIRLTARHDCEPDDANGAVLCDADLRVLSLSAARYDEYAVGIRAEYDAHRRPGLRPRPDDVPAGPGRDLPLRDRPRPRALGAGRPGRTSSAS